MALRFERSLAASLKPGPVSAFSNGQLEIATAVLADDVRLRDARLQSVTVSLASPGDATRVLCCKDVIQPRCKLSGGHSGEGILRLLENVAVVTCGPIVGFQEGIIDMSGPGAAYTPFSRLHLIVLEIQVVAGLTPHAHEEALREAGIYAAERIGRLCADSPSDGTEDFFWDEEPAATDLPKIAYVDLMLSQGLLHDTWVLGEYAGTALPAVFDPRVLLDDAVVSGNCVSACDKNTTYHHQNNAVIIELLRGHGRRWNFAGVVATNCPTRLKEKERSASEAVALVCGMNPDGVIISKEGFGNPDADLMMLVRGLAGAGVRVVAITDEFAGPAGDSPSLADTTPEAVAVVSTGNANERILLPPMATTIGPLPDVDRLAGGYAGCLQDDGSLSVELQAIMGSTNEIGAGCLSCRSV